MSLTTVAVSLANDGSFGTIYSDKTTGIKAFENMLMKIAFKLSIGVLDHYSANHTSKPHDFQVLE